MKNAILFADSNRGIYIPQHFAESAQRDKFKYVSDSDYDTLANGPEDPEYWDAWESVLNNAETVDGGVLFQDGDLWIIYAQDAIEHANQICELRREYEEEHEDSGNNYAMSVSENWDNSKNAELLKFCVDNKIRTYGADVDQIADCALNCFRMISGNIFWHQSIADDFYMDSFHVGEIEIQHENFGLDGVTFDFIRESIDAHVSGEYAYLNSDVVWYASVDVESLKTELETFA